MQNDWSEAANGSISIASGTSSRAIQQDRRSEPAPLCEALLKSKLTMPVLAIGGEKSFGAAEAEVMRNAATNVTGVVVPKSGHWLMEEQPEATIATIRGFLSATP
jgi:pimeloyl-ACP methyl ester carboxylesterase